MNMRRLKIKTSEILKLIGVKEQFPTEDINLEICIDTKKTNIIFRSKE